MWSTSVILFPAFEVVYCGWHQASWGNVEMRSVEVGDSPECLSWFGVCGDVFVALS